MEIMSNMYFYVEHDVEYNVDKFLRTGWTLLLYAASSVEPEIIECLLAHGANPNKHKGSVIILFIILSFA